MNIESKLKRLKIAKIIVLIISLFIGIGALCGGACMIIEPDGSILQMQELIPYFQVLPFAETLFQDYLFPGISLIIVNGITNILASILIIKNKKTGYILGFIFGITLMLWIIIQFIIFPYYFIDLLFFLIGLVQFIIGFIAYVFYKQTVFVFDINDYKSIDVESNKIVIYFSRMGYTRKIAYEIANKNKANIYEIKTQELTENTLGFWWCGRFGMHKWAMKTDDISIDLSKYNEIIIVSPIWVFKMCAPIRDFINKYKDILNTKNVEIVFNHFNPWLPNGAKEEVNQLIKTNKISHYSCQYGNYKLKE